MTADAFIERQFKSQRGRYMAGARHALRSLQAQAEIALTELDRGDVPNIDLVRQAVRFEHAVFNVIAIDELKGVVDTHD